MNESAAFHSIKSISTLPRSQRLVDTAVRIVGSLLAGELLFHAFHPGTKGIPTRPALRLWRLQSRFPRIGAIVGGAPFGVQAALGILAFLALPCFGLSHRTPLPTHLPHKLQQGWFRTKPPRPEEAYAQGQLLLPYT